MLSIGYFKDIVTFLLLITGVILNLLNLNKF